MQSDWKEIYKITAQRTEESEQLYKDIGNMVFSSLYRAMRRPPSLVLKLKGIGTWYMRKQRMEIFLEAFPPKWEKTEEDFTHPMQFIKNENKKEVFNLFKERMKEYEQYVEEKKAIRLKRNETQILLRPNNGEDSSKETSQDNVG